MANQAWVLDLLHANALCLNLRANERAGSNSSVYQDDTKERLHLLVVEEPPGIRLLQLLAALRNSRA